MSARILVVDDDPLHRALIAEYLGLEGFDVCEAEDGPRALARASELEPDIVVLDVQMPEMNGFEVARRLRALAPLRGVWVLFVSSLDIEQRGVEHGGDDFLRKPCGQAELLARVRAGLRRGAPALTGDAT